MTRTRFSALVANHMRFADVQRMNGSTLKKFLRLPGFNEHLELHRIDCLSSHGQLASYDYAREKLLSLPPEAIRPKPLITGRDLIEAGYVPGPRFKEILGAVEDAQLEGRVATRARGDGVGGTRISALIKPRCHPERNEGPLSLQAQQCIVPSLREG